MARYFLTYKTVRLEIMKKYCLIFLLGVFSFAEAQNNRGPKIGYFDMMHILKSVPDFAEANNQLELKAQSWKKEIDDRQAQINLLIEELSQKEFYLLKNLLKKKKKKLISCKKNCQIINKNASDLQAIYIHKKQF